MDKKLALEAKQAWDRIAQDPLSESATEIEQKLWKLVVKVYKETSDSSIINHFLGFYVTLYEVLFFASKPRDKFLTFYRSGFLLVNSNMELMYNIHIRLGDLYRYVDSKSNAKFYYQKALEIDTRRGTAFNQMALCTPLTKAYECLYYFVRAAKAPLEPLKNAETNIQLAISKLDGLIFEKFRTSASINKLCDSNSRVAVSNPENGIDWFYLVTISIYFNDFNLTLNLLLDYLIGNVQDSNINFDFALMSLDIALDWILKDKNFHQNSMFSLSESLNSFSLRMRFNKQNTLKNFSEIFNDGQNNDDYKNVALAHNFILRYFLPLQAVYEKMIYQYNENGEYQIEKHRKMLVSRLINKLQNF